MAVLKTTEDDAPSWDFQAVYEDGSVFPITGATVVFKARAKEGDAVLINRAATITDGANGKFTVALLAADTAGRGNNTYVWEIQITTSGGTVYTVAEGPLEIRGQIA